MAEIWRDISGYEGLYQVSSYGRVKRLLKTNPQGKILKPVTDKNGYLMVRLSKRNIQHNCRIHRLVAIAFIDNPQSLPVVNHKDENIKNNRSDNLEWCTVQYNTRYNNAHLKRVKRIRKPILQLTLDGVIVKEWECSSKIEKELGYSAGCIRACCLKYPHCLSAYGYKWDYKD